MLIGQIIRYGFVGAAVTALQVAIYWSFATAVGLHPQLANIVGYLVAVCVGYVAHGAISFRDHGDGKRGTSEFIRFVVVSLFGLAINAFWVWMTISWLELPKWSPIPFMVTVTPGLVFVLNRTWVYR